MIAFKKPVTSSLLSEMNFGYRKSILQEGNYILLGAEFELKKAAQEDIKAFDEFLDLAWR